MSRILRRQVIESQGTKRSRALLYLSTHPLEALRWVADRAAPHSPLARALPWYSWPAIRALRRWLQPHHTVIEFGGGGSTLFYAARTSKVLTVEDNPEWLERLRLAVPSNVTLVESLPETATADLIAVDCSDDFSAPISRVNALRWALSHAKPSGLIVLDDSWAYRKWLPERAILFAGIGPCRRGVTETALIPASSTSFLD
jgi:hypothetical protein